MARAICAMGPRHCARPLTSPDLRNLIAPSRDSDFRAGGRQDQCTAGEFGELWVNWLNSVGKERSNRRGTITLPLDSSTPSSSLTLIWEEG
jgi:hypothetical protein